MIADLLGQLGRAKVYDLAQPYFTGMPHWPSHPPFLFSLTKQHGEITGSNGTSSAADAITFGGHVGTHIDALNHFSCAGKMFGGAEPQQSYGTGVQPHSVETIEPILRRGVLLDIAREAPLPADFIITPEHLEAAARVPIRKGDVVLIRTGWAQYFDDPARFILGGKASQPTGPGPAAPAAHWLSERGIFAAGSDTVAFEKVPSSMPVHVHLLVEKGIHIIEMLNLEELARANVSEFLFIAAPLKIRGGTGSPIRPLAVVF